MSDIIVAENPLGIKVTFDADKHLYTSHVNGKQIIYTSVTSLISKYFTPFDTDNIAARVARRRNVSVDVVLQEWADKRDVAAVRGRRVHQVCEDVIRGNAVRHTPQNDKELAMFKHAAEAAAKLKERFIVIDTEKIVFDHRLRIAGAIDLLLKYDNTYIICDWKTNKEVSDDNRYNNFGLGPLSKMPDTHISHFNLQLSLYEYLLRVGNYIPSNADVKRLILHVTSDGIVKYPLADISATIKDLILDFLLSNLIDIAN